MENPCIYRFTNNFPQRNKAFLLLGQYNCKLGDLGSAKFVVCDLWLGIKHSETLSNHSTTHQGLTRYSFVWKWGSSKFNGDSSCSQSWRSLSLTGSFHHSYTIYCNQDKKSRIIHLISIEDRNLSTGLHLIQKSVTSKIRIADDTWWSHLRSCWEVAAWRHGPRGSWSPGNAQSWRTFFLRGTAAFL
jgi:hypothetical protein